LSRIFGKNRKDVIFIRFEHNFSFTVFNYGVINHFLSSISYKNLQEIYFLLVFLFIPIKENYSIFQTVYAFCNCYLN